jgi:hypothetical protein
MSNPMHVHVAIRDKDRKIGAMVKALAFEVAGPTAVAGATKEYLDANGYCTFRFPSIETAEVFKAALSTYLPGLLASAIEPQTDA